MRRLAKVRRRFGRRVGYYHQPQPFSKVRCPRPFNTTAIKIDGQVVPCCLQASDPGNCFLGNIHDQSFADIWDGESYRSFRTPFLDGKWPAVCAGCTVIDGLNDNPGRTIVSVAAGIAMLWLMRTGPLGNAVAGALRKYPL